MVDTCNVCCKNVSALFECANCHDGACLLCTKTFIFSGLRKHACCMFCNHIFTKESLFEFFPASWMIEYKNYQKQFAINREESLLPGTTQIAALYKRQWEIEKIISENEKTNRPFDNAFYWHNKCIRNLCIESEEYIANGGLKVGSVEADVNKYIFRDNEIVHNLLYALAKLINVLCEIPENKQMTKTHNSTQYSKFIRDNDIYNVHFRDPMGRKLRDILLRFIKTCVIIMTTGFYEEKNNYNIIAFKNYNIVKHSQCPYCNGQMCEVTKKCKISKHVDEIIRVFCINCGYYPCKLCKGLHHKNKCYEPIVLASNYKLS
jgi:hypothetical protein